MKSMTKYEKINFGTPHHCKCLLEGYEGKTLRNEPSARRCSHSTFVISTPHGAAAIARLLSPHRTALQPQRVCYLHTARRCSHSAFAISTPHGAAATARLPSPHRTGASAAVSAETQGPSWEMLIRQNQKKWSKCTGTSARVQVQR